ncbi:hypothetical protein [Amycolatopsis sp. TNS106]|uniref:hypothetical protein n=1 Tax=Amycolatopsis sp. TNS106 TaxID=2861750 RepID=UPI001C5A077B|nr:hypothetical protein [Amycolatopsis sp. TNS106]
MSDRRDLDFEVSPGVQQDLTVLNDRVRRNPHDVRARNLLRATINTLVGLRNGDPGTKSLEYLSSYPDLSDCRTSYIHADPTAKPSHRIVWRDVPPREPDGIFRREIIAVGERANGRVYHLAGQRLGRPVGYTLAELSALDEPVAGRSPAQRGLMAGGVEPADEPTIWLAGP